MIDSIAIRKPIHHPHFIDITGPAQDRVYRFKPFTGNEPEPVCPAFADGCNPCPTWHTDVASEFTAAHRLWKAARYRTNFTATIKDIAADWQAYADARATMDGLYDSLTTDWPRTERQLHIAHDRAIDTATTWTKRANSLANLDVAYSDADMELAGSKTAIAEAAGIDITEWRLRHSGSDTLLAEVTAAIETQRASINQISSRPAIDTAVIDRLANLITELANPVPGESVEVYCAGTATVTLTPPAPGQPEAMWVCTCDNVWMAPGLAHGRATAALHAFACGLGADQIDTSILDEVAPLVRREVEAAEKKTRTECDATADARVAEVRDTLRSEIQRLEADLINRDEATLVTEVASHRTEVARSITTSAVPATAAGGGLYVLGPELLNMDLTSLAGACGITATLAAASVIVLTGIQFMPRLKGYRSSDEQIDRITHLRQQRDRLIYLASYKFRLMGWSIATAMGAGVLTLAAAIAHHFGV